MQILKDDALTFDDVSLIPWLSAILPDDVEISTRLTREISMNHPLTSAAMDSVSESDTGISIARSGGVAVIHRNMTPDQQAAEVKKVKKSESGWVVDPITVEPDQRISEVIELMQKHRISGIPVVESGNLVGIITNRDIRFVNGPDMRGKVREYMTKDNLITTPVGTSMERARDLLHKHRIEKLLVVDSDGRLAGLITIRDIMKVKEYPNACKDENGRLRVGAAISIGKEGWERLEALIGLPDFVCIDTAHGHSQNVIKMVKEIKAHYPDLQVMAGNVATEQGAQALIEAGADAIKGGVGPGSICTTRIVAGVGIPQITAIGWCANACRKAGVPLIADGGIKYSGDIVKALAIGADAVMIGSLFAGTDESPGETVLYHGRSYKVYRGMGSLGAMKAGSGDRYFQGNADPKDLVPQGIEGMVPYRGPLKDSVKQLIGGIRAGMGYLGARNLEELRDKARLVRVTHAGLRESHVHDVIITKEAPNYQVDLK
jgi:IMP dehydrogenase